MYNNETSYFLLKFDEKIQQYSKLFTYHFKK